MGRWLQLILFRVLDVLRHSGPECLLAFVLAGLAGLPLFQGGLFQHGPLMDTLVETQALITHPLSVLGSRPFWHWPDLSVWVLALYRSLPGGNAFVGVHLLAITATLLIAVGFYQWIHRITHHRWASVIATMMLLLQWGMLRTIPSNVSLLFQTGLIVWMMVGLTHLSVVQATSAYSRQTDRWHEIWPLLIGSLWFLTLFFGGVRPFIATGLLAAGFLLAQARTNRDVFHHIHVLKICARMAALLMTLTLVVSFCASWLAGPSLGDVVAHVNRWAWVHLHSITLLISWDWWQHIANKAWIDILFVGVNSIPLVLLSSILFLLWLAQRPYCRRLPDFSGHVLFVGPWLVGGIFLSAWFPVAARLVFPLLMGLLVAAIPHDLSLPHWTKRLLDTVILTVLMVGLTLVLVLGYGSILPPLDQEATLVSPFSACPVLGFLSWKGSLVVWVVLTMMLALGLFAWSSKARFRGALASVMVLWLWLVFGIYGVVFPVFSKTLDQSFSQAAAPFLQDKHTLLAIDEGPSPVSLSAWFPRLFWANIAVDQHALRIRRPQVWSHFWADRLERANRRVIAVMRESTYYQLPTLMRHQSKVFASGWGWKPSVLIGERAAYSGTVPINLFQYLQGAMSLDRWLLVVYWPKRFLPVEEPPLTDADS